MVNRDLFSLPPTASRRILKMKIMRVTLGIAITDGNIQDSAGDDDKCDYVTVRD